MHVRWCQHFTALTAREPRSYHSVAPGGVTRLRLTEDHRKHDRVASRLRCWCEGDNITVYARIGNLSEGGLFLRTSTPLERGARAVVRFGGDQPIEASARVVWSRLEGQGGPAGMGLAFEEIDDLRLAAIRRIVETERHQHAAAG